MACRQVGDHQQNGVVLLVGLIILLVMTLIGLSAARSTLLEERMSGSNTDKTVAFQVAEAALRDGERLLQHPVSPVFDNVDGMYLALEFTNPAHLPRWRQWEGVAEYENWNRYAITYTGMNNAPPPFDQVSARYYIEEFPLIYGTGESLAADKPVSEHGFYRITAMGIGISGKASVILQSTFKR